MDNRSKTFVLYAPLPSGDIGADLYPKERMDEIKKCASQKARREKYYVWVLLGKALKELLNLEIDNLQFTKNSNGKWISRDVCFSLSHTDGLVAVAISDSPVGVDCELIRPMKAGIEKKMLTECELRELGLTSPEDRDIYILDSWCSKEAVFKMKDGEALLPRTIECSEYNARTERVLADGREYILAYCTCDNSSVVVTSAVSLE